MCRIILLISVIFCHCVGTVAATKQHDIKIEEHHTEAGLYDSFKFFEDPTGAFDINTIASDSFQYYFNKAGDDIKWNEHSFYWGRITIHWNTKKSFVLYSPLLLKWFELYYPNGDGTFESSASGVHEKFSEKEYKTNVHLFTIPHQSQGSVVTYYVKIKVYRQLGDVMVKRQDEFINNSIHIYLFHGLLFGVILVAAFYNFILFIKLKEYAYLYYSLYVVSFAFFGAMIWYYQLNFLWWLKLSNTAIIDLYNIPYTLITIFFLLYAKSFFFVKNKNSTLDTYFSYLIALRIICYFLGKFVFDDLRSPWVDSLLITPVFYIAFITYRKRFQPAKNFLIAFTALYVGMTFHSMYNGKKLNTNILEEKTIFLLCGCTGMFLFSLSLGDRLQLVGEEKDKAKSDLINQMKKNENYKDQINQELEHKVSERTRELEERNKQLDTFVYRASHDIKGPLRSMLGLAQLGLLESTEEVSKGYFEHIYKSSKRLDATLADLLNVVKTNHSEIERSRIDFSSIFSEITSSFEYNPNYKRIHFEFCVPKIIYFESDKRLLYSVMQNLIENGINYSDKEKKSSFIKINIQPSDNGVAIVYEDNGIGIAAEHQDKIFDMFFKIDANSSGTGLGMYIVKTTIDRLGGHIRLESEEGQGTKFTIVFS